MGQNDFDAICLDCGWIGHSRECRGGQGAPIAGDSSQIQCPACVSTKIDQRFA